MEETNNANMNPAMPPQKPSSPSSHGAVWAIVIILAVILAGGAYFWGERSVSGPDESLDAINQQSQSDAEADIEADLNATDVDNVDYDLDEANFNAS
jgi:hypothetical protein